MPVRPEKNLRAKIEQLQQSKPFLAWHDIADSALRYALGEQDKIYGEGILDEDIALRKQTRDEGGQPRTPKPKAPKKKLPKKRR